MHQAFELYQTDRGFFRANFTDRNGARCSVQESSLSTEPCLWLGVDENRMHLTVEQADKLLAFLDHFVRTSTLDPDQTAEPSEIPGPWM